MSFRRGLRRCVGAEHEFEFAVGVGGKPVGVFAVGSFGADVYVDGAVGVLLELGNLGGAAGAGDSLDEGVEVAVVGGDGPILLDGGVGRDGLLVGFGAVEVVAVLVLDGDEVHLSCAHIFDGDEGVAVADAALVDGVGVGVGVVCLRGLNEVGIGGERPAAGGGEKGREALIVFCVEEGASVLRGGVEDGLHLLGGLVGLAFLDAERRRWRRI
jgi:hypothetical protein